MRLLLVPVCSLAVLLTACATPEPVSPARQAELRTRSQECLRAHPEIETYEVDRFGYVTAYYRMAGGTTSATTTPFFDCVFGRR